jgi:hypothetical protein
MNRDTVNFEIKKTVSMVPGKPGESYKFRNHYHCPNDRTKWIDEWSCACNDKCPVCHAEIEPYLSEEINT